MKKLMAIAVTVVLLLAMVVAVPVAAQSDHQGLKGCQVDPNGVTYLVDVGFITGMAPEGVLVEWLGACCVRGDYTSPTDNGFPGGCCKHPWVVPGPPPTSNPEFWHGTPLWLLGIPQTNPHPGDRGDPSDVPQVGQGCQCATINPANIP